LTCQFVSKLCFFVLVHVSCFGSILLTCMKRNKVYSSKFDEIVCNYVLTGAILFIYFNLLIIDIIHYRLHGKCRDFKRRLAELQGEELGNLNVLELQSLLSTQKVSVFDLM
jgi:hypothetical protein